MPIYRYKVRDHGSKTLQGNIEAKDPRVAAVLLRERGLFIIDIGLPTKFSVETVKRYLTKVSYGDIATMTRQFATLITSGLPIIDALSLLGDQMQNPILSATVEGIKHEVEGGSNLATAFEKHPNIFNRLYISLLRTGETSGMLDKVLSKLADNMEKQREFNSKVKSALVYPIIVIGGMGLVALIMMIFVIPKLTALYKDLNVVLPLPTRILIAVSNFMIGFWWLMILAIFGLGFLYSAWRKTDQGRQITDRLKLKVPILGPITQKVNLAQICRTLGLLVGAGIPIIDSINIVATATDNVLMEKALNFASKHVEKGFPLAQSIEQKEVFPPIVAQMIRVGEETGKLDDSLLKLSYYFESESEELIKGLTTALEPLIMIVLGVGVGFLVISIILPIYKITSAI
ncbi:type II secretion system F family protein [Candidatus Gottesmanbacteria bacterium]|nr:type II secretion system F family protein [Candidatus Gottesmanbacteria bacterium]